MSGSGIVELERSEGAEVSEPSPARPGPIARILLAPVHGYRKWISPVLPPSCRFEPSCSAYAVEALTVHGAFRGCWLTLRRLLRCGPWHPGGWDPVPRRTTVPSGGAQPRVTTERAPAEGPLSRWQGLPVTAARQDSPSPADATAVRAESWQLGTRKRSNEPRTSVPAHHPAAEE